MPACGVAWRRCQMGRNGGAGVGGKKYIVLHVDDEPEIWELTGLILSSCSDISVKGASSIAEAVKLISEEPPDLILLDLMMEGESGWELLKAVRDDFRLDTPVVVLTAYIDSRGNPISVEDVRFQATLSKPYDIKSLRETVRYFLPAAGGEEIG